jgi:hypothetical protein
MAGDWAYDEPLPIAAAELTILGLAVALYANRRSHCLFSLPERPMASVCRFSGRSCPRRKSLFRGRVRRDDRWRDSR